MTEMEPILADLLIVNGTVLTMNDRGDRIEEGAVAVSGSEITTVGPASSIVPRVKASKVLDARGCVVMPGLINSHTHAAMTLFRGLADDLPLMEWLQKHIFPAERKLDPDWVYWGTLLACAEMIMGGITTFCDMYLFEHKVAQAARSAGMRALVGEVLYDFPSPHYGPIEKGLEFTEALIQEWQGDSLVRIAVEPHACYTCSPELLEECLRLAEKYDVPLKTHLAENQAEADDILNRYGRRPVVHLKELGLLNSRLIAIHCVAVDEVDIHLLAENQVKVVHNPESNMKLASGVAPVARLLEAGIKVALGTDGCASNNDLDLFGEMDSCAKLHKVAGFDPTVLPAETVVTMATRNGAHALLMEDEAGQIAAGKRADIIVVDFDKPHLTPVYEPLSHLVYAARASDVRHTIIDGKLVMENRELLTIDLQEVISRVKELSKRIRTEIYG